MTDHRIHFSAPMVRALLEGRKTQTRRLAWRQEPECCGKPVLHAVPECCGNFTPAGGCCDQPIARPIQECCGDSIPGRPTIWQKVKPGDRLWVRETWVQTHSDKGLNQNVVFKADHCDLRGDYWSSIAADPEGVKWRPSIHMPRWASRLTLVVTDVRRQRVQEISEGDARAEGVENPDGVGWYFPDGVPSHAIGESWRARFAHTWDALNSKTPWNTNPEVVALTFTTHHCNIDAMKEEAA